MRYLPRYYELGRQKVAAVLSGRNFSATTDSASAFKAQAYGTATLHYVDTPAIVTPESQWELRSVFVGSHRFSCS